ncbi:hypothetical protein SAMN05421790_103143 [Kroppenstedtia eburnea]|uniref:Uncharacterized protein n=1 Tax=Kroppenstedtia eburnea TaxID=714067 RepID=A0A1N7KLS3_9BACL|nr:hypothetical protein SAMN05421790_103143 [Kroppenstedtia eburnea]
MHTNPQTQDVCPVCGSTIEDNREVALSECCSNHWVKQQIDNCYC